MTERKIYFTAHFMIDGEFKFYFWKLDGNEKLNYYCGDNLRDKILV